MLHTQALATSADPSTPAAQVAARLASKFEVEWSAESGFVRFSDGMCTFHSWPEGLRLDAFAETEDELQRIERFVVTEFERSGLRIDWHRRIANHER
jgi:hypothetical protein